MTGSPEHVSPVSQLMNRGSRSTTPLRPHGPVNADPSVDADMATCGCGTRHLAGSTACPYPEWIGPNNWCTDDRTNYTKQWPHTQGRSPPTLYGRAKHAVQPYGQGTATYCPLPWRMLPRASRPIHPCSPRTRCSRSQRDVNWIPTPGARQTHRVVPCPYGSPVSRDGRHEKARTPERGAPLS